MDDFTKEYIIQIYEKAIASFDIEYLDKNLREAGISIDDPEVKALLRELDEYYGIY
jgi:hypothetical protein